MTLHPPNYCQRQLSKGYAGTEKSQSKWKRFEIIRSQPILAAWRDAAWQEQYFATKSWELSMSGATVAFRRRSAEVACLRKGSRRAIGGRAPARPCVGQSGHALEGHDIFLRCPERTVSHHIGITITPRRTSTSRQRRALPPKQRWLTRRNSPNNLKDLRK